MSKRKNPGPVPNRWLRCPRKSLNLIMGKFLAFKAPLNSNFDSQVPLEYRFTPKMLFDYCKTEKIKLGLWIDLTNTNRFYDKEEVEEEDCVHFKLQCRGHGETPSIDQTNTFIQLVRKFIANKPLKQIAVHCTHGFNRTGFLIVSYLVQEMDCSIDVALGMFVKARPPGIYKEDYIIELYKRYGDMEDAPPAPPLPDWCYEDDNSEIPDSPDEEAASCSDAPPPRKKFRTNKNAVFMEGVPNVHLFTEQPRAFHLQQKVQRMCEWRTDGFPGSQPVSMDVANIQLLHKKPYRVSWKADGMRYMMLIDGYEEVYFFDRDHNVFKVDGLRFPKRKDLYGYLENTLLDGEMVIDKVDGKDIPRYLAYDIVKFESNDVGKLPFYPTRLQCLDNEVIKPRYSAMEKGIINKLAEPFSIRKKDFWEITQAASLLGEKFAKTLSHEPDGLIFQPSKEPYKAGRCDEVLKWKPLDMNSIDFRLKIVRQEGEGLIASKQGLLFVGQMKVPFATIKYTKALKDLDNKIVECKFEDNVWKFMRQRTDKSYPNSYETAKAVLGSIQNPVTKEMLLNYIANYRYDDSMPPPSTTHIIRR